MNVHISFSCLLLRKNIVWVEKSKNMVLELKVTRDIIFFLERQFFLLIEIKAQEVLKSTTKLKNLNKTIDGSVNSVFKFLREET
jgi:hypothetical protein